MKEVPISNIQKTFVVECIKNNLRLDGRKFDDFRELKINFGTDYGSAHVTLGETRCLAQCTCELTEPKSTRPNEGLLYINVDLGPMAAIHFDGSRNNEFVVQINRILERTFKDSRCIDLESLCITAEDKVWALRVDLNVLNYEGNIIDCASVAILSALAHFKRPDVSVCDNEIKIHTSSEKDPISTVLHHYPVCISYATFLNGEKAVSDPTMIEERTAESNMIFGFNSYRELCCINLGGTTLTSTNLFLACAHKAANRAKDVVDQVKKALAQDAEARSAEKAIGFAECLRLGRITSLIENRLSIKLPNFDLNAAKTKQDVKQEDTENEMKTENLIKSINENTTILNSNQINIKWVPDESDTSDAGDYCDFEEGDNENDEDMEDEVAKFNESYQKGLQQQGRRKKDFRKLEIQNQNKTKNEMSSDSEEEATMILD